jgi:hypothetical protein
MQRLAKPGCVAMLLKYFAMAPTLRSMDHSLSLSTMMSFFVCAATLFIASNTGPQVKAASPATQTTCSSVPLRSRAGGHAKRGAEGGASVACAIAVVLALRAEAEAVEAFILADGVDASQRPVSILWT